MSSDSVFRLHLPGLLLLFTLIVALLFYLIWPPDRVARTLFFPGTTAAALSGEQRLVPRTRDREHSVELLVEELLLGPTTISHSPALPRDTRVTSVIVRDGTAYVNLNEAAMLDSSEVRVDTETGLRALSRTIRYNERSLDDVIITIDGNVPFAPAYRPIGR